ncbi:hypothetical protein [Actinoplanes sp. CA-252034]|uniref:glycoside hydrolase family 78 protein n=1 Tax=Actinoplanes sp. CA-252034 TaxID=3239906 RepID=UPI003D97C37C
MTRPTHLRAEHLDRPLGLGEPRPRLSWRLPAGTADQKAYELQVDDDEPVRVETGDCVLVPWPARPLASGEQRRVRVRVWTEDGPSVWSQVLVVEAGLLSASDWRADWVSPAAPQVRLTGYGAPSTSTGRSTGPASTSPRTVSTSRTSTVPGSPTTS